MSGFLRDQENIEQSIAQRYQSVMNTIGAQYRFRNGAELEQEQLLPSKSVQIDETHSFFRGIGIPLSRDFSGYYYTIYQWNDRSILYEYQDVVKHAHSRKYFRKIIVNVLIGIKIKI